MRVDATNVIAFLRMWEKLVLSKTCHVCEVLAPLLFPLFFVDDGLTYSCGGCCTLYILS